VIVAFGITAPELSETVPAMRATSLWPYASETAQAAISV
jgi:hypothetical protein